MALRTVRGEVCCRDSNNHSMETRGLWVKWNIQPGNIFELRKYLIPIYRPPTLGRRSLNLGTDLSKVSENGLVLESRTRAKTTGGQPDFRFVRNDW